MSGCYYRNAIIDNAGYNIAILFATIDDIDFCGKSSDIRKLNAIIAPGEFGEFLCERASLQGLGL